MELGEEELAFSEEEAGALLAQAGLAVEPEGVWDLHRRTEGWPTGLLLVAESGGALPEAGGDERLFEYLAQEVLALQPPEVQRFLLEAAVLERFTPDLAAAVTGRPDARALVEGLVARHVFVSRLDARREWYRLHALFRALLRRRLAAEDPARLRELHRRAADAWRGDRRVRGVGPPLAGRRGPAAVVAALEPVAERMIETAEAETLAAWLDVIPRRALGRQPGARPGPGLRRSSRAASTPRAFDAIVRGLDELLGAGEHERAAVAFFRLLRAMAAVGGQHERGIAVSRRYLRASTRTPPWCPPRASCSPACTPSRAGTPRPRRSSRAAEALGREAGSNVLGAWAAATRALHVQHPRGDGDAALAALDEAIARPRAPRGRGRAGLPALRPRLPGDRAGRPRAGRGRAGRVRAGARGGRAAGHGPPGRAGHRVDAPGRPGRPRALGRGGVGAGAHGGHLRAAGRRRAGLPAPRGRRAPGRAPGRRRRGRRRRRRGPRRPAGARLPVRRGHDPRRPGAGRRRGRRRGARATSSPATPAWPRTWPAAPWAQARAALVGAVAWGAGGAGDRLLAEALEVSGRRDMVALWTQGGRPLAAPLLARAIDRRAGPARRGRAHGRGLRRRGLRPGGGGRWPTRAPASRARLAAVAADTPGVDEAAVAALLRDADPAVRTAAGRGPLPGRPALRLVTLGAPGRVAGGGPGARRGLRPAEGPRAAGRAACAPAGRSTATRWSAGSGPAWRPSAAWPPCTPRSTCCAARWSPAWPGARPRRWSPPRGRPTGWPCGRTTSGTPRASSAWRRARRRPASVEAPARGRGRPHRAVPARVAGRGVGRADAHRGRGGPPRRAAAPGRALWPRPAGPGRRSAATGACWPWSPSARAGTAR